jgi:hypothetical protein
MRQQEWMATAQIRKLPRLPKERDLEMDGTPKEKGAPGALGRKDGTRCGTGPFKLPPDIS